MHTRELLVLSVINHESSQKVTHQDLITMIYDDLEKYSHDLFEPVIHNACDRWIAYQSVLEWLIVKISS